MLKKIISILIVFNLMSHCGFSPIHSNNKNANFSISSIELEGERILNNYLKTYLSKFQDDKHNKKFKIKIISNYKKLIYSKDKAANTKNYELSAEAKIKIIAEEKVLKEITVVEKKIIDKNDDNFEEQKEERITKQNFASSISNKIIMELSILNDN